MKFISKKILWLILKITLQILCIYYLIFHFSNGRFGFKSLKNSNEILINKKNEYENHLKVNKQKENKINRLQINNLDLDLLEEELKKNKGIVDKNEILILKKDFNKN